MFQDFSLCVNVELDPRQESSSSRDESFHDGVVGIVRTRGGMNQEPCREVRNRLVRSLMDI